MGRTIAEKVLSAHSESECGAGDIVIASVDFCMAQDGTSRLMMQELTRLGFTGPKTSKGAAVVLDHSSPSPSADVSRIHSSIREFSRAHSIDVHDVGEGVCHQVVPESGRVSPGDLVVGADSHTCTYGALNACSTGLGSADVAAAAHTGKLWFKVPETMTVNISGSFESGVSAKDLALSVIGDVGADGATYMSVEFSGSGVPSIGMDGRMTVSNMAVEMGAKFGVFPFDSVTGSWYASLGLAPEKGVAADDDASFARVVEVDVSDLTPKVAKPDRVDNVVDVADCSDVEIHQVFLGTCTNGRLSDLAAAARILKGQRVRKGLRLIVAPASRNVLAKAIETGIAGQLLASGAVIVSPGCGPCVGTHAGIPSDGERVLSTANRNFRGRMGNNKGVEIFLASPETAAATAIRGRMTDPREVLA
ncbi:TPA: 3-isopropylmalate dehydratase large subunit [Thermoplasmata archaeon]|nr:3-isopropylmalate dehydratase large subunit [Thermoplasmata archaeon]